jgi:hypothetical protein
MDNLFFKSFDKITWFGSDEEYIRNESYTAWYSTAGVDLEKKLKEKYTYVEHYVDYHAYNRKKLSQQPRHSLTESLITLMPYYLLHTIDPGNHFVVDIGCGTNFLKSFFPNTHGVDPHNENYRDECLDPAWYIRNHAKWHRAIAINSMHFVSVDQISNQLSKISGILVANGNAVVTLNSSILHKFSAKYTNEQCDEKLLNFLQSCKDVIKVNWIQSEDACVDGNVHIWFKKTVGVY